MKKIITVLITLLMISCAKDNKLTISNIKDDGFLVESVSVTQESNYSTIATDLDNTIESSIASWEKSPELGRTSRIKTINLVTSKFIKELNSIKHQKDDLVFSYVFTKRDKYNKRYIGQTVLIFDKDDNQQTLYYDIRDYSDNYDILSVKELINKGLLTDINKIEDKK
jgi:hypothetical protein